MGIYDDIILESFGLNAKQTTAPGVLKFDALWDGLTLFIKYLDGAHRMEKISQGDWIDCYNYKEVELQRGEFALLSLGFALELPEGIEAHLVPRSSTFKNYGIIQTNSMGVIDSSYCGDNDIWMMPVYATRDIIIPKDARIAQFRIEFNQPEIQFEEVETLQNQDRGGFGSTGK